MSILVPVASFDMCVEKGIGLAVCASLNVMALSTIANTINTYSVHGVHFVPKHTIHGRFDFLDKFSRYVCSGYMVFMGEMLLVTDGGNDAVHIVDVKVGTCVGYALPPGSICGPKGIAASGSLLAVSCALSGGDHCIRLFEQQEKQKSSWNPVRTIGGLMVKVWLGACTNWDRSAGYAHGQLYDPRGLRFSDDGSEIGVADRCNGRVSIFRVSDGVFVTNIDHCGLLRDVERWQGGWWVASSSDDAVLFIQDGENQSLVEVFQSPDFFPTTIAKLPFLGLIVRYDDGCRVMVLAVPDTVRMMHMSIAKVSWMCAVARAQFLVAPVKL